MKRILLALMAVLFTLSAGAQRMILIGEKDYKVEDIQDIEFQYVRETIGDKLCSQKEYSIFAEALEKTGYLELLGKRTTGKSYTVTTRYDRNGYNIPLFCADTCKVGYTIFAEKDEVLKANGINSFNDLVAKCKEWYGNPSWYDYVKEKGIKVSTGTDYTNPSNVVNMFVAYHILKGSMPVDQLTYEKSSSSSWNYCFGYEPQEYYETLLPHTMLKVWQVPPYNAPKLYINRYRRNNTLTDELGTLGSDETHPIIFRGVKIDRSCSINAYNGYIHSINEPLLYNETAVNAQHERIRVDVCNILPELVDNGLSPKTSSYTTYTKASLPLDYFENMKSYEGNENIIYCYNGPWRALNSVWLQGWGNFDIAIKLPSVSTGTYEIRVPFYPMPSGAVIQYYIGTSSDQSSMVPMGDPYDTRSNTYDENNVYGCTDISSPYDLNGDLIPGFDYGIASDKEMRNRGYMRAPACYSRGENNSITSKLVYDPSDIYSAAKDMTYSTSVRSEWGFGTMTLRKIVGTMKLEQGKEYWLRIRNVTPNPDTNNIWYLDYIELMPTTLLNNSTMSEDWY